MKHELSVLRKELTNQVKMLQYYSKQAKATQHMIEKMRSRELTAKKAPKRGRPRRRAAED